jgi:hypothetical protein
MYVYVLVYGKLVAMLERNGMLCMYVPYSARIASISSLARAIVHGHSACTVTCNS